MVSIINNNFLRRYILEEYYAAECTCKNEADCDGSSFTVGKPQVCTAYMKGGAAQPAVVSSI